MTKGDLLLEAGLSSSSTTDFMPHCGNQVESGPGPGFQVRCVEASLSPVSLGCGAD